MQQYIEKYELSSVLNETLLNHILLSTYKKGEFIVREGEVPNFLYFLVEGRVKFYATSEEGKTLILGFRNPFAVFGDIEFMHKLPYTNTLEAVTDVVVLKLPLTIVHQEGMQYLPFTTFMLEILTRKFYVNNKTVSLNFLYGVDVRVASYLLSMTVSEESVAVSHLKEAAEFMGTTYRHVNRILKKLIEESIIERSNKIIRVIDRERLNEKAKNNVYEER